MFAHLAWKSAWKHKGGGGGGALADPGPDPAHSEVTRG